MNLRKGFRITTWVLSLIAFIGFATVGIYDVVEGGYEYWAIFAIAFASFAGIWLIYWIPLWSVRGFHKIGKEKILKIIKWAVIIFFASILFHLADYVVHKTTKSIEGTMTKRSGFEFKVK